jgi:hypothetical protein
MLGVPMYGCDPRLERFGTKSAGRRLFEEERVPHPPGARDVRTVTDLVDAIIRLRSHAPGTKIFVVKHDKGGSGWGNAIVDAGQLPPPGARTSARRSATECFPSLRWHETAAEYLAKLEAVGASWRNSSQHQRSAVPASSCALPHSAKWSSY